MDVAVRVAIAAAGVVGVWAMCLSAVRTLVLPRAAAVRLPRVVFLVMRAAFMAVARRRKDYVDKDRVLALYAPVSVLLLPGGWLTGLWLAYACVFFAVAEDGWRAALQESGSSLLTLGFVRPRGLGESALAFTEASLGIGMLALVITYLPSIYAAFQRREAVVALLEVRGGPPPGDGPGAPTATQLLWRYHVLGWSDHLDDLWQQGEQWFLDVEESHLSLAPLVFFRSSYPWRSWLTAAGALLDAAAMRASVIDLPRAPRAEFLVRAGAIALRRLCDFYSIEHPRDPGPEDPIAVTREEFEDACRDLEARGVPLKADRDRAWEDFRGWRVNYDVVLRSLCGLTSAPSAPWSGDRPIPYTRPPVLLRRREGRHG